MVLLRSGWMLDDVQSDQITKALHKLGESISARYLLLVDSVGQMVVEWGASAAFDPISLGALAASDMLATTAMAQMMGEGDGFQSVLREGRENNVFLTQAGPAFVLVSLVSRDVPTGWARILIQRTTAYLADVLADGKQGPLPELTFDQENVSNFCETAIDDLWME